MSEVFWFTNSETLVTFYCLVTFPTNEVKSTKNITKEDHLILCFLMRDNGCHIAKCPKVSCGLDGHTHKRVWVPKQQSSGSLKEDPRSLHSNEFGKKPIRVRVSQKFWIVHTIILAKRLYYWFCVRLWDLWHNFWRYL